MTHPDTSLLAQRIHAALPQTQCTRCGYPDCMAYAEAIAEGKADINQCPPGGSVGVARLAAITGQAALPLNPANGLEAPRSVAVIDEAWCIGCTLCLPVCPTDAILGSNKMMHTVIESHCTGCELCVPACPVDCIELEIATPGHTGWQAWTPADANAALQAYERHLQRQQHAQKRNAQKRTKALQDKLADLPAHSLITDAALLDKKLSWVQAAMQKARDKKAS